MKVRLMTRRSFLTNAALTSGLVAASSPEVFTQPDHSQGQARRVTDLGRSNSIVTRRDIATMKATDPQLLMYKDAIREMKQRSAKNHLDPLGWTAQGTLHGTFCATQSYDLQVHYGWLFLPWHRAYLWFLEKKMQAVIGETTLALPYWDWTSHPRIPANYFGADNPLNDITRIQEPEDEIPPDFIDVSSTLRTRRWAWFGGYPKRRIDDPQIEGICEQGVHNNTHNWIGGNMAGFPSAGFDPLFGGHHGNIDRLWEAWRAASPQHRNADEPAWLNYAFDFYDEKGRAVRVAIKELLDTEALGYRYDTLAFRITAPSAEIARSEEGVTTGQPQTIAVANAPAQREQIARALADGRSRVLLQFERVQVPVHPLCVRVFISAQGEEVDYKPWSRNFVGTFTLLPVGDHNSGQLDQAVYMQMEIGVEQADLIRRKAPLVVTLAPVALKGRAVPTALLKLSGVTLRLEE